MLTKMYLSALRIIFLVPIKLLRVIKELLTYIETLYLCIKCRDDVLRAILGRCVRSSSETWEYKLRRVLTGAIVALDVEYRWIAKSILDDKATRIGIGILMCATIALMCGISVLSHNYIVALCIVGLSGLLYIVPLIFL